MFKYSADDQKSHSPLAMLCPSCLSRPRVLLPRSARLHWPWDTCRAVGMEEPPGLLWSLRPHSRCPAECRNPHTAATKPLMHTAAPSNKAAEEVKPHLGLKLDVM